MRDTLGSASRSLTGMNGFMVIHEPHKKGGHAADFDWTCLLQLCFPAAMLTMWQCDMAWIPIHAAVEESFSKTYDPHCKTCWGGICPCWSLHVSDFHCLVLLEVQKSFSCNRLLRIRLEVHLLKAMAARHGASQQESGSTWVSIYLAVEEIRENCIGCHMVLSNSIKVDFFPWNSTERLSFIMFHGPSGAVWFVAFAIQCLRPRTVAAQWVKLWETWWGDAHFTIHCVPSWEIAFHSADSLNWLACALRYDRYRPWLPWKKFHEIRRYIAVGSYAMIFWSREAALLEASDCELYNWCDL